MSKPSNVDPASLTRRDAGRRFYAVDVDGRAYEAEHNVITGEWLVLGQRGARLDVQGRTWASVVAACEAAFLETQPHPALIGAGADK